MPEYNRYTTQKGQLLLNIKPPSRTNIPQQQEVRTITNSTRNIPYTTVNRSYNPPYSVGNPPQVASNFAQGTAPQQIYNSRQIYYGNNQNNSYFNPIANQVYPYHLNQHQASSQQVPSQYLQQSPITKVTQPNKYLDHDQLGQPDSDNSQKRDKKKSDSTLCCFPGYWLTLLLLGFVILSFFLILFKYKLDISTNSNTPNSFSNSTQVSPQNSSASTSSVPPSEAGNSSQVSPQNTSGATSLVPAPSNETKNENSSNTTYKFPSSYIAPTYVAPIQPPSSIINPTNAYIPPSINTNGVLYVPPVPVSFNSHSLKNEGQRNHQLIKSNLRHREILSPRN